MDWDGEVARLRDAQDWDAALTGMHINTVVYCMVLTGRDSMFRAGLQAHVTHNSPTASVGTALFCRLFFALSDPETFDYASVLQIHMCGLDTTQRSALICTEGTAVSDHPLPPPLLITYMTQSCWRRPRSRFPTTTSNHFMPTPMETCAGRRHGSSTLLPRRSGEIVLVVC